MNILELIVIWLPAVGPLAAYMAYQYVKCYRLRKNNRKRLAEFDGMIKQALGKEQSRN